MPASAQTVRAWSSRPATRFKRIGGARRPTPGLPGERQAMNRICVFGGAALAISTIAAARFGGWAVVTVEDPPEYLVVGKPADLTFSVRQHGNNLLPDLPPPLAARSGRSRATGTATETSRPGVYGGFITVPMAGPCQIPTL